MEIKQINEPTIADIIIRKNEVDVCYTTESGQYETKLRLGEEDSEMLTVNYGDVSAIGFGGTDNWGKDRLPIYLDYTKGSYEHDGVFVDTIEIQKQSDWCKCELVGNSAVKYTALSDNPNKEPRVAYFYHTTKDNNTPIGDSGWTVALPSLSKPRYIGTNLKSSRLYDDGEITIMEIYDNGIKLKGYKVREKNKNVYDKNKPLKELIIILK